MVYRSTTFVSLKMKKMTQNKQRWYTEVRPKKFYKADKTQNIVV